MNLTIELSALKATINKVIGAVQKKNTIPALANVALYANGDTLTAKATDLDVEVTATSQANVTQDGAITVDAAMLSAIASKLPAGSLVSMTLADHRLTIKAGRSKYELQTLPIDDYPQMASSEYSHQFTIDAHELDRLFNLSKGAASTEETRYYLQGVYFHPNADNDLCAVSTDGHRLYQITTNHHVDFPGVIVPSKTVGMIVKMLDVGEVVVSVSETKIKFDMGSTILVSKVVDGAFPDYKRVIPTNNDKRMIASASEIKAASDRVATVSDDRSRGVKIDLEEGAASLSTRGNIGEAEETVQVDYSGDKFTFGVNAKYLAETLSQCSGSDVVFELRDDASPIIIRPSDDDGALYVIMPLRF